jgi:raffinose/stachyose/melibiose transport system permease protein
LKTFKPGLFVLEVVTALLFLAFLFPVLLVIVQSSKSAFEISTMPLALPSDWTNLGKNAFAIWTNETIAYQSSFLSSVLITVLSLAILNLLPAQAAWALVRTKTKTSAFLFFMFVAAMVIPFQIVMFPLLSWFRTITVVTGIPLLRTFQGIVLAYLGFGVSLTLFMYHGFIKSIPLELEEAATIDGCSRAGIFYRIIFPILGPIHATVLVLNGIWIWNDYLLPLLVLGKGNAIQTIPVAVSAFAGTYVKQWDLLMTAVLLAMVPVVIFFLFAQKFIIKGMVAGSIK